MLIQESLNCRFCSISAHRTTFGRVDQPLAQTTDFMWLMSIGALVDGWSLIVPTTHCLSLRDHYGKPSFQSFVQSAIRRTEAVYGRPTIFEHGANHHGSATSCGTDHAHLHIVPLSFSLALKAQEVLPENWKDVHASAIDDVSKGSEYLFVSEDVHSSDPKGSLLVLRQPTSQFFRKLIAGAVGKLDVSDYKKHTLLETASQSRERLEVTT